MSDNLRLLLQSIEEDWERLTILDNFIFQGVMLERPDLCQELCEIILGRKIHHITFLESERTIKIRNECRGVRLDVYLSDDLGTVIDLEMQPVNRGDLAKRIRFYQGLIDLDRLRQGQDYEKLNDTCIVFICDFDLFGKKLPLYTFHTVCDECPALRLNDGTSKIFLNAKGNRANVSAELTAFLDYIGGILGENEFIKQLDEAVKLVKSSIEWRMMYVTYEMEVRRRERDAAEIARSEGRIEGRNEGRIEGRIEGRNEGRNEERLSAIKNLMETIHLSAKQAMDALKIAPAEQARYAAML